MREEVRYLLEESGYEAEILEEYSTDNHLVVEFVPENSDREFLREIATEFNAHFYETKNLEGETLVYGISIKENYLKAF